MAAAANKNVGYENLIGQTFTGRFHGCVPDSKLGPRAVFVVDQQGNNSLKRLFQQLRQVNYMEGSVSILSMCSLFCQLHT